MITEKTRRDIKDLADGDFSNCNTEHSLLELVKQMMFAGTDQQEAVRLISRVYQVAAEELSH